VTRITEKCGRFVTFEGGEGAGKSTQIRLLAEAMRVAGIDVVVTREPGGVNSAERIRALLVEGEPGAWLPPTEALLHFAARVEHVERVIKPSLAAGRWVLCDRFVDSTIAYQGHGHRVPQRYLAQLQAATLQRFAPDLTIILDLPVEIGLARAALRLGIETRYELMDRAFHERVRRGYRRIARTAKRRCALVEAAGDIGSVAAAVRAVVRERLAVPMQP
jgi:dTMP kinase